MAFNLALLEKRWPVLARVREKFGLGNNARTVALLLIPLIALVFGRAVGFGFCAIDDDDTLTRKSMYEISRILSGQNMEFTPVTFLSLAFDRWIFANSAAGYHLMNLVFHLFASLAVFATVLRIAPGQRLAALFTAILFAIHPMHVEPVVWISSRKDLLYSSFFLGSLLAYWRYLESGVVAHHSRYYYGALLLAAASLLSKGSAVAIPLLFFLVDYAARRPFDRRVLLDKIPLLLAVLCAAYMHLWNYGYSSLTALFGKIETLTTGFDNVWKASVFYVSKSVAPVQLSVFYEATEFKLATLDYAIFAGVLVWIRWFYLQFPEWRRILVFSVLWFFFVISPYFKLVPYAVEFLVADRYFYLASMGLFLIYILPLTRSRTGIIIAICLLTVYGGMAIRRVGLWRDNRDLISNILVSYPKSSFAYAMLGVNDYNEGKIDSAIVSLQKAMQLNNRRLDAANCLARIYREKKDYGQAARYLETALPYSGIQIYLDLAELYLLMKDFTGATQALAKATERFPHQFEAYSALVKIYVSQLNYPGARDLLLKYIALEPKRIVPYEQLVEIYRAMGDEARASEIAELSKNLPKNQ